MDSRIIDLVATSPLQLNKTKKGRKHLSLPCCHLNVSDMGEILIKGEGCRVCHDIFRMPAWQHFDGT